ncbi:MAG: prolipoprotein diacylglyceryl transferase [Oligoflexia bacterium]|nr:prolipoprotein diacylglyceryl transferase [Oligoflexia bacterium]
MWPFVLRTEDLVLPTYLVVNSGIFTFGILWIYFRSIKFKYNTTATLDIALVSMISCFLGSRLAHIVFEYPEVYIQDPSLIYKFWNGGFVFYGGAIGGFISALLLCRFRKWDFFKYADLFAPVLALGYSIGRFGCFLAGCCFGRACDLPWAVHFPEGVEAPAGVPLHPTQIYSSLWELGVVLILVYLEKKRKFKVHGQLLGLWFVLHGLGRALVEQFRGDFRGEAFINLSVSTWLSFATMTIGLWLLQRKKKNASATS